MLYRILLIPGLVLMLLGAVDPLEGSVVIVAGSVVCSVAAYGSGSRYRKTVWVSTILIVLGVGVLFVLSAMGGVGGRSPHSRWWLLLAVPYPVGWVMGLVAGVPGLREAFGRGPVAPDPSNQERVEPGA